MKSILFTLIAINLFAEIKMPFELYGRYFQSEFGPKSCIALKEDQDPLEIFEFGMSFGTWYVCNPKKIIPLANKNYIIYFNCSDSEGQDKMTRITAKMNHKSIYIDGKLFAERCNKK